MPTENPRLSFMVSDELKAQINDYQFSHKIKNQSQAIISLINKGMDAIARGYICQTSKLSENSSERLSADAIMIAKQYDELEEDGKQFIRMAINFAQRPNQKASSEPEESWISAKDREEYDEVMKLAKDALKKAHPEGRAMNQK